MGLACPVFTVPAGGTLQMPGATYGFTVTLAGPAATWSEGGGSAIPLDATTYLPPSDHQPFGDIIFTADASSPLRLYVAKSAEQAKRLQPPTGASTSTAITGPVTVTGTVNSKEILGASNIKSTAAAGVTGPTNISAPLSGGTGNCSGVLITNTGPADNVQVLMGGVIVASIAPNAVGQWFPVDPNLVAISVQASTSVISYGAVAFYG